MNNFKNYLKKLAGGEVSDQIYEEREAADWDFVDNSDSIKVCLGILEDHWSELGENTKEDLGHFLKIVSDKLRSVIKKHTSYGS